jgi:hypothetical protein
MSRSALPDTTRNRVQYGLIPESWPCPCQNAYSILYLRKSGRTSRRRSRDVTACHRKCVAHSVLVSALCRAFVVAQGPDTFALSPVAPPTRTFLSTRVMAAPVIAPGAIAPLALPSMPHIFARCALPIALPKGAEPELDYLWITCVFRWGAPPIGRSPLCRRIAILGLPRFDALFNSHYVSP